MKIPVRFDDGDDLTGPESTRSSWRTALPSSMLRRLGGGGCGVDVVVT
jgi:hypothetical protein